MTIRALQHEYPRWESAAERGEESGGDDDPRYVWPGRMRVVSNVRARKLRKRGVPLMPLHAVRSVDPPRGHVGRYNGFEPTTPGNGPGLRSARYAWFEREGDAEARAAARRYFAPAHLYDENMLGPHLYAHALHWMRLGTVTGHTFDTQLDLYARAFQSMQVETATGNALDALLAGVPMPAHWTDEQKRHYIQHGYVVEVGHGENGITLWYNGGLADNGVPVGVSEAHPTLNGEFEENPPRRAWRETLEKAERDGLVRRVEPLYCHYGTCQNRVANLHDMCEAHGGPVSSG